MENGNVNINNLDEVKKCQIPSHNSYYQKSINRYGLGNVNKKDIHFGVLTQRIHVK